MKLFKKYKLLIAIGIVFITVLPIIISQVVRIPTGNWTIGKGDAWIGFLGGYFGAVLGGIISGSITLSGVYLAIQNEKKLRIADTFPIKRKNAGLVLSELEKFKELFKPYFDVETIESSDGTFYITGEDKKSFEKYIDDISYLLDISANVNGLFFGITRKIIFNLEEIKSLINIKPIHPYHELEKQMQCGTCALEVLELIGKVQAEAQRIDDLLDDSTEL